MEKSNLPISHVSIIKGPAGSGRTKFAIDKTIALAATSEVAFYSDTLDISVFEYHLGTHKGTYIHKRIHFVSEVVRSITDETPLMDVSTANAFVFDMPNQFCNEAFCDFVISKINAGYKVLIVENAGDRIVNKGIELCNSAQTIYSLPTAIHG